MHKIIEDDKNLKISFISLGCDKNLVDSEIMLGIINENGFHITSDEEAADIIIVNTCGFITDATNEGIETILGLAEYKETGKLKGLIVTGCMAKRYREEIVKDIPEVDAVLGTGDFEEIGQVIKKVLAGEKINMVSDKILINDKNSLKRIITTPGHFAYLKISEGCDNSCTYCTIPGIKGKYVSRTVESILEEAKSLSEQGVKEIILVAQDTALYGKDIYGESMLHLLLQKVSEIENIEWIRILYCYPEHITDHTIDEIATNKKVCHYLDMPIQHADDKILKLMGRKSTNEKLREVIAKLRNKIPDIVLRTTLIVGFPSETDLEFENLFNFVKEIEFDKLGVFAYSREEGTPAYKMKNQTDEETKNRRKDMIMELQNTISTKIGKKRIGSALKVIVDGRINDEKTYCGRFYGDAYEIDGLVFFESETDIMSGEFLDILINEATDYDLLGVVADESGE